MYIIYRVIIIPLNYIDIDKKVEQRRLAQEEKEIEEEQKQLIRRKQLLLRKHSVPNFKRTFPVFTSGRNQYDDSDTDDQEEEEYESEINESDEQYDDENNIQSTEAGLYYHGKKIHSHNRNK